MVGVGTGVRMGRKPCHWPVSSRNPRGLEHFQWIYVALCPVDLLFFQPDSGHDIASWKRMNSTVQRKADLEYSAINLIPSARKRESSNDKSSNQIIQPPVQNAKYKTNCRRMNIHKKRCSKKITCTVSSALTLLSGSKLPHPQRQLLLPSMISVNQYVKGNDFSTRFGGTLVLAICYV